MLRPKVLPMRLKNKSQQQNGWTTTGQILLLGNSCSATFQRPFVGKPLLKLIGKIYLYLTGLSSARLPKYIPGGGGRGKHPWAFSSPSNLTWAKNHIFALFCKCAPMNKQMVSWQLLKSPNLITLPRKVKNALDSEGDAGVRQAGVVRHRVDVLLQVGQHGRRSPLHCGPDILKCRKTNFY